MTRRRRILLWSFAAVFGLIAALGVRAVWIEPASLTVVEERITLRWPLHAPLRIALLSDLHVGSPFNGIENLRRVVDRTNDTRPDIICILGDLVIQEVKGGRFVSPEAIAAELNRLRATDGVFGVLGNHDGSLGHDRVATALENNGVHLVEDRSALLQTRAGPIWIAGISDLWTGQHDLGAALTGIPNDGSPVILLSHNPDVFPQVPSRVSLTLAGHTHGGQVRLPFLGAPIVPSKFGARFVAGHVIEGDRHLYVATGVGTSIWPVRFRVPPAISILTVSGRN